MTTPRPSARTTSSTLLSPPRLFGPPRAHQQRSVVWVVIAVVAGLLLGACGSSTGAGGTPDLVGKTFTSTEVRGYQLVASTAVTLSFEDGRVSAKAGCNTMNGAATWDTGKLVVTPPLASTMMGCDEALMAQDKWLSGFLTSSPALSLEGNTLTLGDNTSGMTLTTS